MEINEREVNSLKKIFQNILFRGLEMKEIGGEGRNLVGEEVGHEPLRERQTALTKSGLSFYTLEFQL